MNLEPDTLIDSENSIYRMEKRVITKWKRLESSPEEGRERVDGVYSGERANHGDQRKEDCC